MKLRHIPNEACSVCGAEATVERVGYSHANGTRQEFRTYACGAQVEFVPNFGNLRWWDSCLNDPEQIALRLKRRTLDQTLRQIVSQADVDEEYRSDLHRRLES